MSDKKPTITLQNLEAALAGESMAHIKYRYFAQICRAHGDEATAKVFEETAAQEVLHAIGHMELLYPRDSLNVEKALALAIEGETYEYTEMYPNFRDTARKELEKAAEAEFAEQIDESREHAEMFRKTLEKAGKRFAALAKVEERHAKHYQDTLDGVKSA
ncbi:MAG: rubrerythrin [Gammaproteobacteria bacterium HGW-Gammaproteobacteria-14]|nr:MAG: rubrerythrin [Gammaproteobacteria bacterium HGW-Gammaproteobacteria-14]